jgi:hypothetical protein
MNIPSDFDFILFVNCLFLFLIAYLTMTFNDSSLTISNINELCVHSTAYYNASLLLNSSYLSISPESSQDSSVYLLHYRDSLLRQNRIIPNLCLFIYWLLLPLSNLIYGFYCYRKGLLRHFYKKNSITSFF